MCSDLYTGSCRSVVIPFFLLMTPRPPRSTLFPYTTLFRSADEEPLQLLLVPRGHERGSLHRPHPGADPDALEIAAHRLGERGIGWKRCEVARIEAVGIARFRQELLGALGIERGRLDLQREVELRRHEPSRGLAIAQHLGLIDRVAVDDQAGRLADAAVVPG